MALKFNGVTIPTTSGSVKFNGASFNEVKFNGVTMWKVGSENVPPAVPGFCDASDDQVNKIIVQWGYSHYLALYVVYRDDIAIGTVANGDLWFEDLNVDRGVTYTYKVKACWEFETDNCSDFSESDTGVTADDPGLIAPTLPPTGLTASDGTIYDYIAVSWTNVDDPAARNVEVHRSLDGTTFTMVSSLIYGSTTFFDYGVVRGEVYTYKAAYSNAGGLGPFSNADTGSLADNPTHTHPPADIIPQGAGSGLDSDLLDGKQATEFPWGSWTFDGTTLNITVT